MEVGNLRTRLSFESTGESNITDLGRDLKGIRSEMNNFRSSSRAYRTSVQGMRQESDILSRRLEVQRERVAEIKRRYDEAREATGENSARTKDLAAQYNNAQAQMKQTEQQLERLNQVIRTQESRWTRLGEHLDTAGQRFQTFGRATSRFGRQYSMRVTTPILGAGLAALKAGMDFQEGMSEVQAISGATGDELSLLEAQARELGAETRFSATEAADGMSFLARAGFEVNEIMETMPSMLDLAAASNMDLGRAADISSNILQGFALDAEEAGRVSDLLANAAATANTDVEQMGDAMSYVAPVAQGANISIEETAAVVGMLSDAGIQGSRAGTSLRRMISSLQNPTGATAKALEDLEINLKDVDPAANSLSDILDVLADAGVDSADAMAIAGDQAGPALVALLAEGGSELKDYTKELENSEGAAKEMADVMQDNAKGAMIEFKSALEGAGIEAAEHMLPAITDITKSATDLVRKFGDLDKEQQQQILKWAGIAAAVGPAAIVLGQASTAIGGILRVGGSLSKLLGRASGAGLIARLGSLGPLAIGGVAVAGIAGIGTAIYNLTKDTEESIEEKLNYIEAQREEIESTDELIESYEELRNKSGLTTDEVLRYMDIMTELENAESEEAIKKLTKEQEELLEKSGFTNEEMEDFLRYNDEIIEKTPGKVDAISEQGNAYAGMADELKELNNVERERLVDETYIALTSELEKQRDRLEEQKSLEEDLKQLESEREEGLSSLADMTENIRTLDSEILDIEKEMVTASEDELPSLAEKLTQKEYERGLEEDKLKHARKSFQSLLEEIEKKEESIEKNDKELEQFEKLSDEYAQMVLYEEGIVSERGKANEALEQEQKEVDKVKKKLEELKEAGKDGTAEYEEQNRKVLEQQARIDTARKKLEEMNEIAGETIYKDMNIDTKPKIPTLNQQLSSPISRTINLTTRGGQVSAFADGTPPSGHKGGPFIAGEEGWELGRMGNRWEMLNFGLYDRPKGYEVFPHDESKRILQALSTPQYADGARPRNEASRTVNQINDQSSLTVRSLGLLERIAAAVESGHSIKIGEKEIIRATVGGMNESMAEIDERKKAAWGG